MKLIEINNYRTKSLLKNQEHGSYRDLIADRAQHYVQLRDQGIQPENAAEQVIKDSFRKSESALAAHTIARFRSEPSSRGIRYLIEAHVFMAAMTCCLQSDLNRFPLSYQEIERFLYEAIDANHRYMDRYLDESQGRVGDLPFIFKIFDLNIIDRLYAALPVLMFIFPGEEKLPEVPRDFFSSRIGGR